MAHPKSTRINSGIRYTRQDGELIKRAANTLGLSVNQFAERTLISAARIVLKETKQHTFGPGETAARQLTAELSASSGK